MSVVICYGINRKLIEEGKHKMKRVVAYWAREEIGWGRN